MEIPFTPAEIAELNAFIADFNKLGDSIFRVENHLAEVIRHQVIRPWRQKILEKATERRRNIIASLPPEADAELQALANKYSLPAITVRTK